MIIERKEAGWAWIGCGECGKEFWTVRGGGESVLTEGKGASSVSQQARYRFRSSTLSLRTTPRTGKATHAVEKAKTKWLKTKTTILKSNDSPPILFNSPLLASSPASCKSIRACPSRTGSIVFHRVLQLSQFSSYGFLPAVKARRREMKFV